MSAFRRVGMRVFKGYSLPFVARFSGKANNGTARKSMIDTGKQIMASQWFKTASGAAVVSSIGYLYFDRMIFEPKGHEEIVKIDKTKNFQKFLSGHHIPLFSMDYTIERKEKEELLAANIKKARVTSCVVNIVADKELGKSCMVAIVAKQIDDKSKYKIFYVNTASTLRGYLEREYGLIYETEKEGIKNLVNCVIKYSRLHPKERIIVIMDSPGGIAEEGGPE
eukprot:UN03715